MTSIIIIFIFIIFIIIIRTFITRKSIQHRKCARQQSKAEQISFQFTAKSDHAISIIIGRNALSTVHKIYLRQFIYSFGISYYFKTPQFRHYSQMLHLYTGWQRTLSLHLRAAYLYNAIIYPWVCVLLDCLIRPLPPCTGTSSCSIGGRLQQPESPFDADYIFRMQSTRHHWLTNWRRARRGLNSSPTWRHVWSYGGWCEGRITQMVCSWSHTHTLTLRCSRAKSTQSHRYRTNCSERDGQIGSQRCMRNSCHSLSLSLSFLQKNILNGRSSHWT